MALVLSCLLRVPALGGREESRRGWHSPCSPKPACGFPLLMLYSKE